MKTIISVDCLKKIVKQTKEQKDISALFLYDSFNCKRQFLCNSLDFAGLPCKEQEISIEREVFINEILKKILSEPYYYEVYKVSFANLLKIPLTMQMNILREGELLFYKDKIELADYKEQLIRRYCDFEPDLEVFNRDYHIGLRSEFLG